MTEMERRASHARGIAAAPPALASDDLRHIVAALEDSRRYADNAVARYFRDRLESCAIDDGSRGPKATLPPVLGVLAAVQSTLREARPEVRKELLSIGVRGAEFAGWLYRDIGMAALSEHWQDRAIDWARESSDAPLQGYVMLRKSQGCWDARDARRMGDLARAAQHPAWKLPPRVQAEAVQQEARSMAMSREASGAVERKLDRAREILAAAPPVESENPAGTALGNGYSMLSLDLQTAICLNESGQPVRAVELYRDCLNRNVLSYRDEGYFSTLMAEALAVAGEPSEAADTGLAALRVAEATSSARTLHELLRLSDRLNPWSGHAAVRDFNEALSTRRSPPHTTNPPRHE